MILYISLLALSPMLAYFAAAIFRFSMPLLFSIIFRHCAAAADTIDAIIFGFLLRFDMPPLLMPPLLMIFIRCQAPCRLLLLMPLMLASRRHGFH